MRNLNYQSSQDYTPSIYNSKAPLEDPTQRKRGVGLRRAHINKFRSKDTQTYATSTLSTGELLHNSNEQKHKAYLSSLDAQWTRLHKCNPKAQFI
jgi:hypothetical protein